MSDAPAREVRGVVVVPEGVALDHVVLAVTVEDVSRADAPSQPVGSSRIRISGIRAGDRIPFAVQVPEQLIDPRRHYSVRVHVDRSGSERIAIGDLVSTQSYPVLTRGYGTDVTVAVKQV